MLEILNSSFKVLLRYQIALGRALVIPIMMLGSLAYGWVPEGLEAYSEERHHKGSSDILYGQGGYVNPSWTGDYEVLQSYASFKTASNNIITTGAQLTTGNKFGDRDGYFGRFDLTFVAQSISFKFAHEDLRYVQAGENTFSLDYNASFQLKGQAELYLAAGIYYRFTLNSWNTPTWNPINYNTDDTEMFLELCLGTRLPLWDTNYVTIDMNNRDPYTSYNGDNFSADVAINFPTSRNLIWRIMESTRFSGLFAGTADVGQETIMLGFETGI